MLKSNSGSSGTPNVFLAQTGNDLNALCCASLTGPWIVDSGASDHMTSSSNLFHTYVPCSSHEKIRIADGSYTLIAGKGTINLSKTLTLKSVHVPKLACNLLFFSKLSKDSNCLASFCDSYCVFQDWNLGRKIGSARMIDGLYHFEDAAFKNEKPHGLSSISDRGRSLERLGNRTIREGNQELRYSRQC
ncbi:hypothetical protein Sjap_020148 [Stephania japonica]|uniref:Retrovirus-related Pol polyprotein from transposon TNT 1-94-like beta-barrel domain-containing protein n=1 Tax=Stephania japonica TaxID=461633 RepID=A0AAP0F946_9MAGN